MERPSKPTLLEPLGELFHSYFQTRWVFVSPSKLSAVRAVRLPLISQIAKVTAYCQPLQCSCSCRSKCFFVGDVPIEICRGVLIFKTLFLNGICTSLGISASPVSLHLPWLTWNVRIPGQAARKPVQRTATKSNHPNESGKT